MSNRMLDMLQGLQLDVQVTPPTSTMALECCLKAHQEDGHIVRLGRRPQIQLLRALDDGMPGTLQTVETWRRIHTVSVTVQTRYRTR